MQIPERPRFHEHRTEPEDEAILVFGSSVVCLNPEILGRPQPSGLSNLDYVLDDREEDGTVHGRAMVSVRWHRVDVLAVAVGEDPNQLKLRTTPRPYMKITRPYI